MCGMPGEEFNKKRGNWAEAKEAISAQHSADARLKSCRESLDPGVLNAER
jgi:hypothetical protein